MSPAARSCSTGPQSGQHTPAAVPILAGMRNAVLFLLAVLAGVSGCSSAAIANFDTGQKPKMAVFLRVDSTQADREAAEAAIRALPGVDDVTFVSQTEAYAKFASRSPDLARTVKPEDMPPSFEFTTANLTAYNKIRNGSFPDDVKQMPGVADIVIQCATLDECKRQLSSPPALPR